MTARKWVGSVANSTLTRGKPIQRRTPLKPQGAQKARREKAYRAYLRSATWKRTRAAAITRAGGQCEQWVEHWRADVEGGSWVELRRCSEPATQVHHLRYPKTLGTETPAMLQALCRSHHEHVETTQHWYRHTHRRRSA